MSDRMTPIPFSRLMEWILEEKKTKGTVFGVHQPYRADRNHFWKLFGCKLEMPFGPAAGPHTQLAQNLAAAYYAGGRFFELKTVQSLDGEDLPVSKPCIRAEDEGYNVEWSTELYVPQAFDEYVKAWFVLHVIAKEFELGAMDGFQFNMSIGYDLKGIKSEKIDRFIEGLKDASQTQIYKECMEWLSEHAGLFERVTFDDIRSISPAICSSATLSTLHGCRPQEIESIAEYLLKEKKLHTFIKINPTLLGYEYARNTLDQMGYDYVTFNDFHFKNDLQYDDAIPMIKKLLNTAKKQELEFGVKLTNTLPVDIKAGELPGQEMYMSGKALYPLSMSVAAKLSAEFEGKLRISYSGGADCFNIEKITDAGIWPVTTATTLLKPGGYQRIRQMAELFENKQPREFTDVDSYAASSLAEAAKSDKHLTKAVKLVPSRKIKRQAPLTDCFIAPCQEGCPIGQDITAYMKLAGDGRMKEALRVIAEKNPLPFITGTICAHNCMSKCTRNFYEAPVNIRRTKLEVACGGYEALLPKLSRPEITSNKKAAVVGGGPAGLAAAYFLLKGGMQATIFEREESLGGVVRSAIPGFRIPDETIDKDVELIRRMGVRIVTRSEITSIEELKKAYDYIILAVGASEPGDLKLEQGEALNAVEFLKAFKKKRDCLNIGKNVVVAGGGNTAMDAARAAKRTEGVEKVSVVYRRTRRYMPADEEELSMALEEGVEFLELLSPQSFENGSLKCRKMRLGEPDAGGRPSAVETGDISILTADTVIAAVGEQIPYEFYRKNGLQVDGRGRLKVNGETLETSIKGVYAVGDGSHGPATVAEAIRDAGKAAGVILKKPAAADCCVVIDSAAVYEKRGKLADENPKVSESSRCLHCGSICENCAEVCPNRANVSVQIPGMKMNQIVHIDQMCNECGNCRTFCPYDSAPYLDKLTLFSNETDMKNSNNKGFTILDGKTGACKVRLEARIFDYISGGESSDVPENIRKVIAAVIKEYPFLYA